MNRVWSGSDYARAATGAVSVVVVLTLSWAVHAQSAPAASPAPPPTIEIVVVGPADAYERLHALLDRRLSAMGSTAWSRAERVDATDVLALSPGHALRCWIDLSDRRRARLAFAARSGERFLVRDFELPGDMDEIDRAALAEVIELSIGALIEDERAGLSREETQALLARRASGAPAPPATLGPAPSLPSGASSPLADAAVPRGQGQRFNFGVFYAAEAVADGLPIDNGPGLSMALSDEPGPRLLGPRVVSAGWVSVQYLLPETLSGAPAGVGLEAIVARFGVEVGPWRWRLRAGAGWDFVHVSPQGANAALALASPHWNTNFAFEGAIRVAFARVRGARFWVSVVADVVPAEVDYGVVAGGNFQTVFSPWRIRPGGAVEVTFP